MNSLYSSTTDKERLIKLIKQSSNTITDAFVHIGGKLAKLTNQRRYPVSREMIRIMKWRATIKWKDTIIMSPCQPYLSSSSSSCPPFPLSSLSSCQPIPPMDNPIIIANLSYLCRSPSSLRYRLAEMQTIVVLEEQLGALGEFGR